MRKLQTRKIQTTTLLGIFLHIKIKTKRSVFSPEGSEPGVSSILTLGTSGDVLRNQDGARVGSEPRMCTFHQWPVTQALLFYLQSTGLFIPSSYPLPFPFPSSYLSFHKVFLCCPVWTQICSSCLGRPGPGHEVFSN